jgi:hypothetical protein
MKFAYRKKFFLAPAPGDTSSILLEAEDSDNGQKKSGQYAVVITELGWKVYRKPRRKDVVGFAPEWRTHALEYFDLVLTGGDAEKFWKELLATAY